MQCEGLPLKGAWSETLTLLLSQGFGGDCGYNTSPLGSYEDPPYKKLVAKGVEQLHSKNQTHCRDVGI